MRQLLYLLLLCFLYGSFQPLSAQTRNPLLRPYTSASIWNMPIGSDAVYEPANLTPAQFSGADIVHILITSESFPSRDIFAERGSFNIGGGRCSMMDLDLGFDLNVPDDWLVPDSGNSPYGGTPNSSFAIITTDSLRSIQGQVLARCDVGGPVFMPDFMRFEGNRRESNLRGDGLSDIGTAGHGASGLSTLGGTIRLGELTGTEPIRHAIKINPFANKSLHYSAAVPGFRWPASRADNYANNPDSPIRYNPDADSNLVMGALLALPPEATPASLGLTTDAGRKLFFAMQNYGVYFAEDAAFDTWDIVAERDVEIAFEETYGFGFESATWLAELNKLMTALSVIVNNGPNSIGGGGTPRVPLSPEPAEVPLQTFNVFRLHPLSDPTRAVTLIDAGPEGRFGFGNSHDLRQRTTDEDDRLQLWKLNREDDGRFQFKSVGLTRKRICMDVDNSGTDGATNVHTWECGNPEADNRLYNLVPVPGGDQNHFYLEPSHARILDFNNTLRVSVEGDLTADGANVASLPANGTDAQIFILQPVGNNDILERFSLPVQLTQWSARAQSKQVRLNWATATEVNTRDFVVEHSVDAARFTAINTVPAAGNSDERIDYTFTDLHPATGTNYYRLRQRDLDGRQTFTSVVAVDLRAGVNQAPTLRPNPVEREFRVAIPRLRADGDVHLAVIDGTGRLVYERTRSLSAGRHSLTSRLPELASGGYTLLLTYDGERHLLKFVVR